MIRFRELVHLCGHEWALKCLNSLVVHAYDANLLML